MARNKEKSSGKSNGKGQGSPAIRRARASKRPLTDEISATSSHDLFEVFIANTIINPDKVVQRESRGEGLKLYEEIEDKDGHIASVIQTRKLAVTGKEWEVIPASDSAEDKAKSDFVEKVFESMNFDKVCLAQLDAIMKGFAVSETMFDVSEGDIWITNFKHRKPWRFVFTLEGDLQMLTERQPVYGEPVPTNKFWTFTFAERYENRYGKALGQKLFWPYLFKKNNVRWWAIFNEKFGSPTAVGKYRPGTKRDMQDKLLFVIKSIQQETGVVIPDDMAIELLEAARQGSFETYSKFMDWCEESQSKIVLGQTLTTQHGSSSLALGMVHERVRSDITKADADMLCASLNEGAVRQLADLNFSPSRKYPKIWIRAGEEHDLIAQAGRDKQIFDMGYKPKKAYIEDTYGMEVDEMQIPPRSDGGSPRPPLQGGALSPKGEFAEGLCPHCFSDRHDAGSNVTLVNEDKKDTVDHLTDRVLQSADLDPWLKQIEKIMNESGSLEDFRDRLLDAYKGMDPVDLGNLLQRAFTTAELAGRFVAGQGAGGNAP